MQLFISYIAEYFITLTAADIIGYIASVCMVFGYLPQTIHTIKTRKTDDIAVGTFLLMGIGGFFFGVQGLMLGNMPLLITNIITFTLSAIIFGIKMYNDHFHIKDRDVRDLREEARERESKRRKWEEKENSEESDKNRNDY